MNNSTEKYSWTLVGKTEGHYPICLKVAETGQQTWTNIWIKSNTQQRIKNIYQEYVIPLEAEMVRHLSQMHHLFASETIRDIPFRIHTLEEFSELLYLPETVEKVREIVKYIRMEESQNWPLLNQLLAYIAPSFSLGMKDGKMIGACVPFDPDLTSRLMKLYPGKQEELRFNFLFSEGSHPEDIKMTLASALACQKYGHGFFYSFTTLGKQLGLLYKHKLLGDVRPERLMSPYPRTLYKEYGKVIGMIADSATIVNEGFAAWLELSVLQKMDSEVRLAIHQRKKFIEQADKLKHLRKIKGGYFNLFPPVSNSSYVNGYNLLNEIVRRAGTKGGEEYAIEVMLKAADIDFGIGESRGKVMFNLPADQMMQDILNQEEARSDAKFYKITRELRYQK